LGVLGQAELFEPVGDLLHSIPLQICCGLAALPDEGNGEFIRKIPPVVHGRTGVHIVSVKPSRLRRTVHAGTLGLDRNVGALECAPGAGQVEVSDDRVSWAFKG
jgi:hypothetical protein